MYRNAPEEPGRSMSGAWSRYRAHDVDRPSAERRGKRRSDIARLADTMSASSPEGPGSILGYEEWWPRANLSRSKFFMSAAAALDGGILRFCRFGGKQILLTLKTK
jgi:hypothetical protein